MSQPTASVVMESNPCWCKPVRLDAESRCTTCGHKWEACAAADAAYTMPVTGVKVPAALSDVTVKILGETPSADGVAFRGEVRRGRKTLGTIEQDGRGGGTWFRPASGEDRAWWDEMVAAHTLILEGAGEPAFIADENLANDLYEEAALARDMNRKRSVTFRLDGDCEQIFRTNVPLSAPPARVDAVKAKIAADYKDRSPELWVKNTGWSPLA